MLKKIARIKTLFFGTKQTWHKTSTAERNSGLFKHVVFPFCEGILLLSYFQSFKWLENFEQKCASIKQLCAVTIISPETDHGPNVLTGLIFSIAKMRLNYKKNVVRKIRERCVTRIKRRKGLMF